MALKIFSINLMLPLNSKYLTSLFIDRWNSEETWEKLSTVAIQGLLQTGRNIRSNNFHILLKKSLWSHSTTQYEVFNLVCSSSNGHHQHTNDNIFWDYVFSTVHFFFWVKHRQYFWTWAAFPSGKTKLHNEPLCDIYKAGITCIYDNYDYPCGFIRCE